MAQLIGELEALDQSVAYLLILRLPLMTKQTLTEPLHRLAERGRVERHATPSGQPGAASSASESVNPKLTPPPRRRAARRPSPGSRRRSASGVAHRGVRRGCEIAAYL